MKVQSKLQIKLEVIPFAVGENQRRIEKKQAKKEAKAAAKNKSNTTPKKEVNSRSPSHERRQPVLANGYGPKG